MATVLSNALSLLQSSQLADFTVKCGVFEWKVHHIILASGSKFFEKACGGNFQEATDKVITLHDDDPKMVARTLLCLYSSTYPDIFDGRIISGAKILENFLAKGHPTSKGNQFTYEKNPLMVHSNMYVIANKYDMLGLQALCVTKFDIGENPTAAELKNLIDVLPHVYTSMPSSKTALRLKAAALVRETYDQIMHKQKLKAQLEFACVQNGQLGWDLLSDLLNNRKLYCAECGDGDCELS